MFEGGASGWSCTTAGLPLQKLFSGFPLLYVTDAVMLLPPPQAGKIKWEAERRYHEDAAKHAAPQRYQDVWFLNPSIQVRDIGSRPLYGFHTPRIVRPSHRPGGLQRYTDLVKMMEEVQRLGQCVKLAPGSKSITPHQVVSLSRIVIHPANPAPAIQEYHEREKKVNGIDTCLLVYGCIQPRGSDGVLCDMHSSRIQGALSSKQYLKDPFSVFVTPRGVLLRNGEVGVRRPFVFQPPISRP